MTVEQVREALAAGVVVAFDTSALHGPRAMTLAGALMRWNHANEASVLLVVSALCVAERNAQERRRRGEEFDPSVVTAFLETYQMRVEGFTEEDAGEAARWFATLAPTDDAWQELKVERFRDELGTRESLPRVSASVDWFIAAHAYARGWLLVTDDKGPEFRSLTRRCGVDVLMEAVA